MQEKDFKLNFLILGKTGVGKSSLLNALLGRNVTYCKAFGD